MRPILKYKSLVWPHRWGLLAVAVFGFAEAAITLAVPVIGGQIAGTFLDPVANDAKIGHLVLLLILFLTLIAITRSAGEYFYAVVSQKLLVDLRSKVFEHVMNLPLAWHQSRNTGNTLSILTSEVDALSTFISGTLVSLPSQIFLAIGASIAMLLIDPILALLGPFLVPIFYLAWLLVGRGMRTLSSQVQSASAETMTIAEEMLNILPAIKTFQAESTEIQTYRHQLETLMRLSLKEARVNTIFSPFLQLFVAIVTVVLLAFAGQNIASGAMKPSELVSLLLYLAVLVQPISGLSAVYGSIQRARGTLERLDKLLQEAPEIVTATKGPTSKWQGEIEFRDVTFSYPGRLPALNSMSLHIPAGQTIAITGDNGAGKSTSVALLLGLFRPNSGSILFDGEDIAQIPLARVRGAIGYVPQTRYLKDTSVIDNIRLGADQATVEQVRVAAQLAQAHDFISKLPDGYDTRIGDKGVRLSGGQQQRIALARALLRNPPVLILDEATSMFDLDGEADFVADCREVMRNRTVILIAHRPATLALADRIVHMANGSIISDQLVA